MISVTGKHVEYVQMLTLHCGNLRLTQTRCSMQADTAASLKTQPKHTKLDEIQEEIQMQAPDTK